MTSWNYFLSQNFDELITYDERGTTFYSRMNDFCQEFASATKTYGAVIKKICDKHYQTKPGDYYNNDRAVFCCFLDRVGEVGLLCEKVLESYNEHSEIFKMSLSSFKCNNKRTQRSHEEIQARIAKEEAILRKQFDQRRDAHAKLLKTQKKTSEELPAEELEKIKRTNDLQNEIYSRMTANCTGEVEKFNSLRENCICVEVDALIKELNSQMKRRVEAEKYLARHFTHVLKSQFSQILCKIGDLVDVNSGFDSEKVEQEISSECIKRDLPDPVVLEDCHPPQKKDKSRKIISRIYSVANQRAKLLGLRKLYRFKPKSGSASRVESLTQKMEKEISSLLKKLSLMDEKASTDLVDKIMSSDSFFSVEAGDGLWGRSSCGEFRTEYIPIYGMVEENYKSSSEGTVSVKAGERLEILCEGSRIGWHYVDKCSGQQGYVPAGLVRIENRAR